MNPINSPNLPIDLWQVVARQFTNNKKIVVLKSLNQHLNKQIKVYKLKIRDRDNIINLIDKFPDIVNLEINERPFSKKHYYGEKDDMVLFQTKKEIKFNNLKRLTVDSWETKKILKSCPNLQELVLWNTNHYPQEIGHI